MPKKTDRQLLVIDHGDEQEELLFDPGKLILAEMIAIEEQANLTMPQVIVGVNAGRMSAVRAVVWILRKRKTPQLRLQDVEFTWEQYSLVDPDLHPDYMILEPGEESPFEQAAEDEPEDPKDEAPPSSDEPATPTPQEVSAT